MGIIKAAKGAITGGLADQWLEVVEPFEMNNKVIATYGVLVRQKDSRNSNRSRTEDVISNGSIIHVPENVFMLLVDGGRIIAGTDEAGYYQVDNSRAPSVFFRSENISIPGYSNTGGTPIERPGGLINTLKDSWERFKFAGTTPVKQKVVYINKQEIPDFRFGTKQPVLFADRATLNGTLLSAKVTSFGTYSIKVNDPMLFYREVYNKEANMSLTTDMMAEQYINEFLMAYQTALSSLAKDGISVIEIQTQTMIVGKYMADVLDDDWLGKRGFYISSVGIASIGLDKKTEEIIDKMNEDSILLSADRRAARMTRGLAAGIEAAGSNEAGAMQGFMGIGMGMNATGAGGGIGQVMNPQAGQGHQAYPNQGGQAPNYQAYAGSQGQTKNTQVHGQAATWKCPACSTQNMGKFCTECGSPKPQKNLGYRCDKCGFEPKSNITPKFCPECGDPFTEADRI